MVLRTARCCCGLQFSQVSDQVISLLNTKCTPAHILSSTKYQLCLESKTGEHICEPANQEDTKIEYSINLLITSIDNRLAHLLHSWIVEDSRLAHRPPPNFAKVLSMSSQVSELERAFVKLSTLMHHRRFESS